MKIRRIFQFGLLILLLIGNYETEPVNNFTQELNFSQVLGKYLISNQDLFFGQMWNRIVEFEPRYLKLRIRNIRISYKINIKTCR